MNGLPAGDLNRLIVVQKHSGALDAYNQPSNAWTNHATIWCSIRTASGMSSIRDANQGVTASVNLYSFRVRYRTDITSGMRISYGGEFYDIVAGGIKHDMADQQWTDLVAAVGGNNG